MNDTFSETQFIFGFMFEVLKQYPEELMPFFPTTNQESEMGYDVKIGGSLFLQFKRPRFLQKEKIYEIDLTPDQFDKLYHLKRGKPANMVFYVAPLFHTQNELEKFFSEKSIEKNSALFPLDSFPTPDNKEHTIVYPYDNESTLQKNILYR